jgi:hypothetical protein
LPPFTLEDFERDAAFYLSAGAVIDSAIESGFEKGSPSSPAGEKPGFRVGLTDDNNESARRSLPAVPSGVAPGNDPYSNVLKAMVPTIVRPAGLFYQGNSGLFPTPNQAHVPVSGGSLSQDPLRQAVDRATNPYANSRGLPLPDPLRQAVDRATNLPADPGHPAATSLGPSQIGGLIGTFLGGTLGGLTLNPHIARVGAGIGGGLGLILGGEYGNGNAGQAISTVNSSGLAGVPGM